jgi:exopolysaccharide production protein ExoQ
MNEIAHWTNTPQRPTIGGFLSRPGWLISIVLCVMFAGMMQDFRSGSLSIERMETEMLRQGVKFEQDVTAALPERKIAFVIAALLAAYCIATAGRPVDWQSSGIVTLIAVSIGWIAASWLWSVEPGETAREMVRLTVFTALVYGLSTRFTPQELCRILLVMSILTVVLAITMIPLLGQPVSADGVYRLGGTLHPNPLARFALMIAIPSLAYARDLPHGRWKWLLLVAVALAVIQLTRSRTALASCLAGLAAVLLVGQDLRRLLLPASMLVTAGAIGIVVLGLLGQSGIAGLGNAAAMGRKEQVSSLTGRLPLWSALLDHSKDRRLVGAGYGAFWNAKMNETIHNDRRVNWYAGHAHSCYVELLVNIGLVGMSLIMALALFSLRRTIRLARSTGQVEYVILAGLLCAAFVNGIAESGFILPRELAIVSALMAFIIAQKPVSAAFAPEAARSHLPSLSVPSF